MSRFSELAWADTAALRQRIIDHPFNRELAAGTLAEERFSHYVVQDALYLEHYGRALALTAGRAPDAEAVAAFARFAVTAIEVERSLHAGFFETLGIPAGIAAGARPAPACAAYTSFLAATAAIGDYRVMAASLLPCFWVYWEVGTTIARSAAPENRYQPWIDTYSDPDFARATETAIALVDRAAADGSDADRQRMMRAFRQSTLYEWMFWDGAYRLERWPLDDDG